MDHIRLKPMPLKSGREPTAVTKKSIQDLLVEEGLDPTAEILMPAAEPEPEVVTEDVRVFDHAKLMPMKGKSGREPTAITHKSIKELLAEEGVDVSDVQLMPAAEPDAPVEEPAKVLDHTRLQPLKGQSKAEPTAFTHKSIAELLAEEGVDINDMPLMKSEPEPDAKQTEAVEAKPAVAPREAVSDAPKPNPFAQVKLAELTEEKPRSFLGRLMGG